MALDPVVVTLQAMAVKPKNDKGYARVRFKGKFKAADYEGNEASTYQHDDECVTVVQGKCLNRELQYTLQPSEKYPNYSPSIKKVVDTATGEVVFETKKSQGGKGGGYKGGGGYNSMTPEERAAERASIEVQVSMKLAGEVALAVEGDAERFEAMMKLVESGTERLAKALHDKAVVRKVATTPPPQQQQPPRKDTPPAQAPAAQAPATDADAAQAMELVAKRNLLLSKFGSVQAVRAAWALQFGSIDTTPPMPGQMQLNEIDRLLSDDVPGMKQEVAAQ